MRCRGFLSAVLMLTLSLAVELRGADAPPLLADAVGPDDVALVNGDVVSDVWVDAGDHAVVQKASVLFADDVERVTGHRPRVIHDTAALKGSAVFVGTLGKSPVIDALVKDKKLDVSKLAGAWESFVIQTVEQPLPGVDRALVIVGSDRRGTAFGVFEVSEQIGVSPWYWWADVTPTHRDSLAIKAGTYRVGPPAVKYRGIFINDEDWGLQPWAAKTFEPELGNIGPKTYDKVFELLLRLKGNYLWPAMHKCSTEFGSIDGNSELADEWGIVMGASHCEPMNRNNVWFDEKTRGPWRYDTNREGMMQYWEEWAQQRGKYEAVWTVGMRGIHDSGMKFPTDLPGQVKALDQAIVDQRALLKKYVNADVTKVPQVFMAYKEALAHYQNGLHLPDDVTTMWCDDNFGYIRQLSIPEEQKRSGGSGVYYHISYLGRPKPYLWLNTTPPALIYAEMTKALAYGADRIWVVNVGDIKPGEIGMDFWMRLGWNPKRYGTDVQRVFLKEWATREFGSDVADPIADVMNRYYHLGAQRKPELMEENLFTSNYEEAHRRDADYAAIERDAIAIKSKLPAGKNDAFFELVLYPVRMAALVSHTFFESEMWRKEAAGRAIARMEEETRRYNEQIAGGKWRNMVMVKGYNRPTAMPWPKGAAAAATQPSASEDSGASAKEPANRLVGDGLFIEHDGGVSIEAEHFQRANEGTDAKWQVIKDLGRSGDSVTITPANAPSSNTAADITSRSPSLEYDLELQRAGDAKLAVYCLPTHRINAQRGLRYAFSIDNSPPRIVDFDETGGGSGEASAAWNNNVAHNISITTSPCTFVSAGKHTLKLWMVDPGVIVDKIVIDLGGVKQSELGPPETRGTK